MNKLNENATYHVLKGALKRQARTRHWIAAVLAISMVTGLLVGPRFFSAHLVFIVCKGVFAYLGVLNAIAWGWSGPLFNKIMRNFLDYSDDWWLTGAKGRDMANGLAALDPPGRKPVTIIAAAAGGILGVGVLVFPHHPAESMLAGLLLWMSGLNVGLFLFLREHSPFFVMWVEDACVKEMWRTLRWGDYVGLRIFAWRAVINCLKMAFAISLAFCILLLPAYICGWGISGRAAVSRSIWQREALQTTIPLFPAGFLVTALIGAVARRRSDAITRKLAQRFDELMELRRIARHEVGGPRPVGGPKT